jgi:hypothetical protein
MELGNFYMAVDRFIVFTHTYSLEENVLEFQTLDNWASELLYSYIDARVK